MEVFGGHDAACFSSISTRRPAMAIQLYDRFNYPGPEKTFFIKRHPVLEYVENQAAKFLRDYG
jgi:hypothetical protein